MVDELMNLTYMKNKYKIDYNLFEITNQNIKYNHYPVIINKYIPNKEIELKFIEEYKRLIQSHQQNKSNYKSIDTSAINL